jgi:RNA polymerase sigma factor (sigma-70 family)
MGTPGDDDPPGNERGGRVEDAYTGQSARLRHIVEKKFNIPPNDAEAIVNDVFTSYLTRRDSVRDANKWLIGAVCHASRAYWRAAARTSQLPEDVAEYVDDHASGLENRIVDRVTMSAALNRLGPRCRETLRLYYAEGYSAKEIAERFGTTTGYVIQLLHVCRKRVRQAYDALKEKKP